MKSPSPRLLRPGGVDMGYAIRVYGKLSAKAISLMSYLAEKPDRRAGSREISKARRLPMAITAKLLTQLSSAGLLTGQPGPGGGYALSRSAAQICLLDIVSLFENPSSLVLCPFGPKWCGHRDPCPLHDAITEVQASNADFLRQTSLAVFMVKPPAGKKPKTPKPVATAKKDK